MRIGPGKPSLLRLENEGTVPEWIVGSPTGVHSTPQTKGYCTPTRLRGRCYERGGAL